MSDDNYNELHAWIEPELEARMVAAILDEASDFERDELERLMDERPELRVFKRRLEAVHALIGEAVKKESGSEWKLSPERRAEVLKVIGGQPDGKGVAVIPRDGARERRIGKAGRRVLAMAAACLLLTLVLAFLLSPMWLKTKAGSADTTRFLMESGERDMEADIQPPLADYYALGAKVPASSEPGSVQKPESLARIKAAARPTDNWSRLPADSSGDVAFLEDGLLATDARTEVTKRLTELGTNLSRYESELGNEMSRRSGSEAVRNRVTKDAPDAAPEVVTGPVAGKAVVDTTKLAAGFVDSKPDDGGLKKRPIAAIDADPFAEAPSGSSGDDPFTSYDAGAPLVAADPFADTDADGNEPMDESRTRNATGSGAVEETATEWAYRAPGSVQARSGSGGIAGGGGAGGGLWVDEQEGRVTKFDRKLVSGRLFAERDMAEAEAKLGYSVEGRHDAEPGGKDGNAGRSGSTLEGLIVPAPATPVAAPEEPEVNEAMWSGGVRGAVAGKPLTTGGESDRREARQDDRMTLDFQTELAEEAVPGWKSYAIRENAGKEADFGRAKMPEEYRYFGTPSRGGNKEEREEGQEAFKQEKSVPQFVTKEQAPAAPNASMAAVIDNLNGTLEDESFGRGMDRELGVDAPEIPGRMQSGQQSADSSWFLKQNQKGAQAQMDPIEDVEKNVEDAGLVPPSAHGLVTRAFVVPPVFQSDISGEGDEFSLGPQPMVDDLRSLGVQLEAGATAEYDPASSTLTVRATEEALAEVEELTEAARLGNTRERQQAALGDEETAEVEPFSTFSLHVSDVSFKLAHAALAKGEWPDSERVRVEEFVNALDYGDPAPSIEEKVACQVEQAVHPFLQQRNLLRISMRTAALGRNASTPLRLTLLLDNSGSMDRADRVESVQSALKLLAAEMNPQDEVTLISFARTPRLLREGVTGDQVGELVEVLRQTPSEGGTNLEQALQLGMEKAKENFLEGAQNRVILLTDGAANLGNAEPAELAGMVETMRESRIAFDACGVGAEGLNDEILESLTRKGDGRYYFLDRPEDADAGFAKQIAGALRPAAQNVKVQVEFNPKRVGNYKLLGFEKHRLEKEDFRNDSVDAAEMAAEEEGVAVYQFEAMPEGTGDVGNVSVRFRDMETGRMVERNWTIPYEAHPVRVDDAGPAIQLAASAAMLAEKLKGSAAGEIVQLGEVERWTRNLQAVYPQNERIRQLFEMTARARELAP